MASGLLVCHGWFTATAVLNTSCKVGVCQPFAESGSLLKPFAVTSASKGIQLGIGLKTPTGAKSQLAPVAQALECRQCKKVLYCCGGQPALAVARLVAVAELVAANVFLTASEVLAARSTTSLPRGKYSGGMM